MPDVNLTRPGQVEGAGDSDAMFLETYGGETLAAFDEKNVMMGTHVIKSIDSGKSKVFPATWKTGAAYHVPGNRVVGDQTVLHNERRISIDDVLLSDIFLAELDELRNDHDVRGEYAKQQGAALARAFDMKTMQVAVLAARESATVTGGFGGTKITAATAKTSGSALVGALAGAAQSLDEKDVWDDGDRFCPIRPAQWYLALQSELVINRDYGANGSIVTGSLPELYGIKLAKSNNVPQTDLSAVTEAGTNNDYFGDFSNVVAPVFHRSAIGTLKRLDLTVQKTADDGDYAVEYQGVMLVAKYNMGHGILRPEAACEIVIS